MLATSALVSVGNLQWKSTAPLMVFVWALVMHCGVCREGDSLTEDEVPLLAPCPLHSGLNPLPAMLIGGSSCLTKGIEGQLKGRGAGAHKICEK